MYDIIIVGGGAAGTSAALTARNRGKTVAVIANPVYTSSMYKAESMSNYPGMPEVTGEEMARVFREQLVSSGAELINGRVLSAVPMGGSFGVAVGSDFYECRAVILAPGITREKLYPGEAEYLGRGVSYCATCDGMLYRGKTVALIGGSEEARHDAEFLRGIGCNVIELPGAARYEIIGTQRAEAVVSGGETYPVDGVFIIKDTVSIANLMPGLERSGAAISVGRGMETSIPGVFAAGDCTGKPYQAAQARHSGRFETGGLPHPPHGHGKGSGYLLRHREVLTGARRRDVLRLRVQQPDSGK